MEQFEKCPFCGGEASLISGAKCSYVFCNACGAETGLRDTPDEAIALWNKRKSIDLIIERLEVEATEHAYIAMQYAEDGTEAEKLLEESVSNAFYEAINIVRRVLSNTDI